MVGRSHDEMPAKCSNEIRDALVVRGDHNRVRSRNLKSTLINMLNHGLAVQVRKRRPRQATGAKPGRNNDGHALTLPRFLTHRAIGINRLTVDAKT